MFRITLAAITILLAVSAAPAFAGKGGGTASSSIAIASVSGGTNAAAAPSSTARLGDTLTFKTTVEPLAGWEYPMVAVSCYQDVNGDGTVQTNLLGPDVVFTWLDRPNADFTLGGYSSIWTVRGGGPAVCRADLDAYGWKRGKESTRVLATTGDWNVAG
jgi:ABC-type glycerol-3-phosphate transport system substrate-binding protein